jgi:hypothetical protein
MRYFCSDDCVYRHCTLQDGGWKTSGGFSFMTAWIWWQRIYAVVFGWWISVFRGVIRIRRWNYVFRSFGMFIFYHFFCSIFIFCTTIRIFTFIFSILSRFGVVFGMAYYGMCLKLLGFVAGIMCSGVFVFYRFFCSIFIFCATTVNITFIFSIYLDLVLCLVCDVFKVRIRCWNYVFRILGM